MQRIAVFVDAGYLFAEGSVLLTGARQPREHLVLDAPKVVSALKRAAEAASGAELLRIYWYDAARRGVPTPEQEGIADADGIKLRLGQTNRANDQKGVDGLIITDLVELARNRAITDAMLLSGDEDLRVGVLLAQQFGVRVHLLGIHNTERSNQSRSLMQEADTTNPDWGAPSDAGQSSIAQFLRHMPPSDADGSAISHAGLEAAIETMIDRLDPAELASLQGSLAHGTTIPHDHDKALLALGRTYHARDTLSDPEKTNLRSIFRRLVQIPS